MSENSIMAGIGMLFILNQPARIVEAPQEIKVAITRVGTKYGLNLKCFNKVLECESHFKNECNRIYGCSSGIGIGQLTPGKKELCGKALKREIDLFNPFDNVECAAYLMSINGTNDWGYPVGDPRGYYNGIRWGSYDCFKEYCE